MPSDVQKPVNKHDVFISYSRKQKEFARKLEKALESYNPPKDLPVEQRPFDVFRDEDDITGVEYNDALDRHLQRSDKLIVICSPEARQSTYVNDEIERFTKLKGAGNIIPILFSGIPNNEAKPGQEAVQAFPEALCKAQEISEQPQAPKIPLAINYVGFDPRRDKIDKGIYYGTWFSILANIYALDRKDIEQRDKKRQTRARRITASVVSVIILVLSLALLFALISRQQAEAARSAEAGQRQIAEEKRDEANQQRDIAQNALTEKEAARKAESKQREKAVESARIAKVERDNAVEARNLAEERRQEAVAQRKVAEERLYISNMGLAQRAYAEKRYDRMNDLLTPYLPVSSRSKQATTGGGVPASADLRGYEWYHFWHLLGKKPATLVGHSSPVTSVAYSPDGKMLVTAGGGSLLLWETSNRQTPLQTLDLDNGSSPGPGMDASLCVTYSRDGKLLAALSHGGTLKIWNTGTQLHTKVYEELKTFQVTRSFHASLAFSPDGDRLAAACDGTIRLWDTHRWQELEPLQFHGESVAFSPDGKTLAARGNKNLKLWNAKTWIEMKPPEIKLKPRGPIAFSPTGNVLATVEDSVIRLWDTNTWKEVKDKCQCTQTMSPFQGHQYEILSIAFSADGRTLATGGKDHKAILWDTSTGEELATFTGPLGHVYSLAFSPDGKTLATGVKTKTGARWNTKLWDISWPSPDTH